MFVAIGCNKQDDKDVRVTTYTPQDITQTTVMCGGDAIVTQGLSLTELGVCWGTERNPTAEGSHLSTTNWSEPYVCTITGLNPGTNYHVRAYALRGLEYYYGEDKSFTTEGNGGGGGGGWDNHTWVDLGLPSGTLWATCNVGATTPEGYGDYFAWGETQPKEVYNLNTYIFYNGTSLPKYTGNDGLTILQPMDDAATVNWGSGWSMPTREQWQELLDYTIDTWTTQNGVNGRRFVASNGGSLFLPAAGYHRDGELYYMGSDGMYWSSSLYTGETGHAWPFDFDSDDYYIDGSSRYHGMTVRAVREN